MVPQFVLFARALRAKMVPQLVLFARALRAKLVPQFVLFARALRAKLVPQFVLFARALRAKMAPQFVLFARALRAKKNGASVRAFCARPPCSVLVQELADAPSKHSILSKNTSDCFFFFSLASARPATISSRMARIATRRSKTGFERHRRRPGVKDQRLATRGFTATLSTSTFWWLILSKQATARPQVDH